MAARNRRVAGVEEDPEISHSAILYLTAFAVTQLIEAPVYALVLSRFLNLPARLAIAGSVAVNTISHPLFTFFLVPMLANVFPPVIAVMAGELLVCALEAGLLYGWLRRGIAPVIAASLAANGASMAAGLVVFALG